MDPGFVGKAEFLYLDIKAGWMIGVDIKGSWFIGVVYIVGL